MKGRIDIPRYVSINTYRITLIISLDLAADEWDTAILLPTGCKNGSTIPIIKNSSGKNSRIFLRKIKVAKSKVTEQHSPRRWQRNDIRSNSNRWFWRSRICIRNSRRSTTSAAAKKKKETQEYLMGSKVTVVVNLLAIDYHTHMRKYMIITLTTKSLLVKYNHLCYLGILCQ